MEIDYGIFDIKLEELNQGYIQMQRHIKRCQNSEQRQILNEIQKLIEEIKEDNRLLQTRIDNSRSQTVSKLAKAQLDYNKKIMNLLDKDSLASEESAILFAEFVIDFATQSTRQALLAALYAINIQFKEEEERKEKIK